METTFRVNTPSEHLVPCLLPTDCLVLLAAVHAERLPPAPAHSPAANSIKAAIREEARKRGTEHLLRDADEGGRPRNLLGPVSTQQSAALTVMCYIALRGLLSHGHGSPGH
jgi:hypothetical protein